MPDEHSHDGSTRSPKDDSGATRFDESESEAEAQRPRIGEHLDYFGDYRLLSEIARGGMGVVYRAKQSKLNRVVALKMILKGEFSGPFEIQRFQAEAESAASLDHPYIVPIYEVGEYEGRHFFTMKLIKSGSMPLSGL